MLSADLFKSIGLYYYNRDLINMFGMIRKKDAAAEVVRKGIVLRGIDDSGA